MSRRSLGAMALVAGLALAGAACSSKSTPTPNTGGGTTVQATAQLTFTPVSLSVKAGQTVTWANSSGVAHTVTFDSGPAFSQQLADGGQVTRTFATAGTFPYHCTIHGASMHGTIVVT